MRGYQYGRNTDDSGERKKNGHRTLWTLFKTCFIISGCTFGGGMVIISMLQKKFVEELNGSARRK